MKALRNGRTLERLVGWLGFVPARRLAFYQRRVELLEREQRRMRDPERTLVCDILANGQLLPDPTGKRYGTPNAELSGKEIRREDG